jgi:hypothetical protein
MNPNLNSPNSSLKGLNLEHNKEPNQGTVNQGRIFSIRGSVVDVYFHNQGIRAEPGLAFHKSL